MGALMWTAAGLALLLLVIYFGFCALLVHKFLSRRPYDPERFFRSLEGTPMACYIPELRRGRDWWAGQPMEDVYIQGRDGLRLHGFLVTRPNPRGTLLLAHGYRSCGIGDFGVVLQDYHDLGFDLLVIDHRAHGKSQGKYLTMGVLERYDIRDWALWLLETRGQDHRVVLDGISMGAATVMMAAGLDLPLNVKGIIADCGYTSPRAIFEHVMGQMKLPRQLLWGADLCARVMAGFSVDGASAPQGLANSSLPLLMVHGEDDDFVPCFMSRENYLAAAARDKTLLTVPGAAHGLSYLVDRPRVYMALVEFLDRVCPKQ